MQKPIAEGIVSSLDDDAQLIGSRCADCGAVVFPAQTRCPGCSGPNMAEHLLPRSGTLVTYTVQSFFPGEGYLGDPATFEPYGVGLVQLGDEVRVESRLTEADPDRLEFGMPLELTIVPLATDDEGDEIVTFAFAPAQA